MHSFEEAVPELISTNNSVFYSDSQSPFYLRGDHGDFEQLPPGNGFHQLDAVDLSRSSIYNGTTVSNDSVVVSNNLQVGGFTDNSVDVVGGLDTAKFMLQKSGNVGFTVADLENGQFEMWEYSGLIADSSQQTDISTNTDDKNQFPGGVQHERLSFGYSPDPSKERIEDQKTLHRLAQNREAARKSRMRKKVYIQRLENSRQRVAQLEQDLKGAQQKAIIVPSQIFGNQISVTGGSGSVQFDVDYADWLEEHQKLINDLRSALKCQVCDGELQLVVNGVMSHYDEIFHLKSSQANLDVFHILSGMWETPVERCFMWLGGFRSSDILKILGSQIEPLTEQQLVDICNLQTSSKETEDALSEGMVALQESLVEAISPRSLDPRNPTNLSDYMSQMAIAMSKLAMLENFLHQADLLRLQTLQQLQRILTTRQVARALLAINDYKSKLKALSTLWRARPI